MRTILLFLTLVVWNATVSYAQTYYFEKVAEVKQGNKVAASGDGHFITFTSKGCYDSDIDGLSEEFGFREYKSQNKGILNYYGDSYFGKAYYYFNADKSRLNVKPESGDVTYVYVRKTPPAGVTHSGRVKTPPAWIAPVGVGGESSGGGNASSSHGRTCSGCGGTGNCSMCKGVGYYKNSFDGEVYKCPSCSGNGKCKVCFGSGVIR